jgi:ABC-type multidrug transport system ATPase subunit
MTAAIEMGFGKIYPRNWASLRGTKGHFADCRTGRSFIGPNGAGNTTIKILTGDAPQRRLSPHSARVARPESRQDWGYVPENRACRTTSI